MSVKQWNFVWHPNEILDVYSPEGVFVRAFIEGFIRYNDHRGRVDPYPGFIDAVGFPLRKALRDALSLDVSESPARGAQDFAIASRAQVGGEVSVEICASFVRCTYRTPDNTAWLYFGNGSGFFIHRVTYALPSAYPFVSGLVVVTRARPLRTRRLRWTP